MKHQDIDISRMHNNHTYHETSFGGYASYYSHLTPSGQFLPDKNNNIKFNRNRNKKNNDNNPINHI